MTSKKTRKPIKDTEAHVQAEYVHRQSLEEGLSVSASQSSDPAKVDTSIKKLVEDDDPENFEVVVTNTGSRKKAVARVIREITNLSLSDSLNFLERRTGRTLTATGKRVALEAKRRLEEAGAEIEIYRSKLQGDPTTDAPPPDNKKEEEGRGKSVSDF
jgi:ribosomal protein L7/L12